MLDLRFSSALTAMLILALADEEGSPTLSSAQLADKMGTNASLVRKLIAPLAQDGLVVCAKGRSGGARLARPVEEITLAEIYRCSTGDKPLWNRRSGNEHDCRVAANAQSYFAELTAEAEQAVLGALGDRTLADGVRELRRFDREPAQGTSRGSGTC
ncbi:Rrf2 family transcriptional repressor of oqxAB [Saccharopolyspora lacisalsi]|uniref:Rrf2 family transcriptional repressor of oqxAB n=1 Tax=Halosaccharopolyspora lacisalsi TaxID=1000566 RepID=A0A839DNH3_9PSEU|nr:Rrf2 family transcriptional regulator [Halosaccharopolyspora lacisalsi]MBA8823054.1 Rrf2 family transcriptional repressor of oqxAB [Halosaccharopolyspora lacisalsi]